jgi:hypothetical protein
VITWTIAYVDAQASEHIGSPGDFFLNQHVHHSRTDTALLWSGQDLETQK